MVPSNLLSMHWIVVMVRFVYGFVFHNLHPSMVWTMGLWFTSFIRPWLRRMLLRLNPVLSFRRVYLGVYFSFWVKLMDDTSLRPRNLSVHACLPPVDHSGWMHRKWRIPIQLCIYLKIHHIYIYIYLKIQTYANHSSRVMAHAWELVPLGNKNNTNSSKNSTKVRTLMYFLGDY